MADEAAKSACSLPSSSSIDQVEIPLEKAVGEIAAIVKDEWQSSWNRSACFSKSIVPSVDSKINFSDSRCIGMSMIRCALNHAGVSDVLFKMNLVA